MDFCDKIRLMDKNLQKRVKELNKSVRNNWKNGYEEQGEMMGVIAGEITNWLQTLWTIGVGAGVEFPLINKCLKLCQEILTKVTNCGSRTEFDDIDDNVDFTIKNDAEEEIYNGSGIFYSIGWVWRELLLVTLNKGEDTLARTMINDLEWAKLLSVVGQLLPDKDETEDIDGRSIHHGHWSEKTRQSAERLKTLLFSKCMEIFTSEPTERNYTLLFTRSLTHFEICMSYLDTPLKASTLDRAREHFFATDAQLLPGTAAVEFFKNAGSCNDLVRVLERMDGSLTHNPEALKAKQKAVSYLLIESNQSRHRAMARLHLDNGTEETRKAAWTEVTSVFPGIKEAFKFMDEQLAARKLTKREKPSKVFDTHRDAILDKFVNLAQNCGKGRGDNGSDVEDDECDDSVYNTDEDDSDSEDADDTVTAPNVASALHGWVAIVNEWPKAVEAKEIRSQIAENNSFYSVDGVAGRLAGSAKPYVAECIQALYVAFGPDGPAKTKLKKQKF